MHNSSLHIICNLIVFNYTTGQQSPAGSMSLDTTFPKSWSLGATTANKRKNIRDPTVCEQQTPQYGEGNLLRPT